MIDDLDIKSKLIIESPLVISKFLAHAKLKNNLVAAIENTEVYKKLELRVNEVSKCDYDWSKESGREWVELLLPDLVEHLKKIFLNLGFGAYEIKNIWFQRYIKDNIHNWHVHTDCQFTGVYYLELPPNDELRTEIIQPFDLKTKFQPEVEEGDILIFPSHALHRCKRITLDTKKIIISFNINGYLTNEQEILKDD